MLRGPGFRRLFFDLHVAGCVPVTARLRATAALKISLAGSHASHFTAAEIWSLAPPQQPLTHVSVPPDGAHPQRTGIKVHDAPATADVVELDGLRVSSPVQAFLELVGRVGLVELVVIGDRLVRRRYATPQRLLRAALSWRGPGARLARRAARLVRAGVDSPMESRLRMLLVLAGLPEPKVNLILRDRSGDWRFRLDLSYPDVKLVVEYDGRQHAEDSEQWGRDLTRREFFDRWGWRLIVVRADGIYNDPERTLQRVATALRERGATAIPRRFSSEWRQHFPGQATA